jgi:hypothetical protein
MSGYVEKYLCGKAALEYWDVPAIRGKIEPPDMIFPEEYVIFTDKPLYRPDRAKIHTCSILGADKYVDGVLNKLYVYDSASQLQEYEINIR